MEKYQVFGSYPRWATHKVKLTFQADDYKASVVRELNGNCMGASVLVSVVQDVEDISDEILDENGGVIILVNSAGRELEVDDAEGLSDMLVAAEIIEYGIKA